MEARPLIVIVGPTASGKTSLAVDLAEKYGGEIICADSRTVYKGMDIGTAKPSREEQRRVKHWAIDLVSPDERFTAADFKRYATEKMHDIRNRGCIPFLVGGTGLYIDGVVFDYQFGDDSDQEFRSRFELMSLDELYLYCIKNNIELPENRSNKRYVIRAIEQKSINGKRNNEPLYNTIIVGITTDKALLRTRIEHRTEQLFEDGVVDEAKQLGEKYGWDSQSMTGNIYRICRQYQNKEISLAEAKRLAVVLDWRLAKRQLTWLRRNEFITWLGLEDARKYLSELLAPEH